jgi:hypothetical protein
MLLTKPNTFRHNQPASVASLRRLFAFTGTPFGFPLESPFTFTGIPSNQGKLSEFPRALSRELGKAGMEKWDQQPDRRKVHRQPRAQPEAPQHPHGNPYD